MTPVLVHVHSFVYFTVWPSSVNSSSRRRQMNKKDTNELWKHRWAI